MVKALGGYGLFGVELFVCGDEVIFSEVSPRPHDTGMVTMISQDLSEFALHVRAFLGLPIGAIRQYGAAASAVILPELDSRNVRYQRLETPCSPHPDPPVRQTGNQRQTPDGRGAGKRANQRRCRCAGEKTAAAVKVSG